MDGKLRRARNTQGGRGLTQLAARFGRKDRRTFGRWLRAFGVKRRTLFTCQGRVLCTFWLDIRTDGRARRSTAQARRVDGVSLSARRLAGRFLGLFRQVFRILSKVLVNSRQGARVAVAH